MLSLSLNERPKGLRAVALAIAVAAMLVSGGCAGDGASPPEGERAAAPNAGAGEDRASSERVEVGGTEALVWGE